MSEIGGVYNTSGGVYNTSIAHTSKTGVALAASAWTSIHSTEQNFDQSFRFAHRIATWHRLPDLIFCSCFLLVEFSYRPFYPTPYPLRQLLNIVGVKSMCFFLRLGTFLSPFFAFAAYGAPWFSLSSWCFLSSPPLLIFFANVDVSVRRSAKKKEVQVVGYGQRTYH